VRGRSGPRACLLATLSLCAVLAAQSVSGSDVPRPLVSDGGTFALTVAPSPSPIPLNEPFELTVSVRLQKKLEDRNPLWLSADARMPSHEHGMNTRPRVEDLGEGKFQVRGLLFHMAGEWEISFDVARGRVHEHATLRMEIEPQAIALTDRERKLVLSLSPLPAPAKDSTNSADGNPDAIGLGVNLFFDKRLSGDGRFACASCHEPKLGWSDGLAVAVASETGTRNTPSLWNVAIHRWFFWDGHADSLWSQALKPIENGAEMNGSRLAVAHLIASDQKLRSGYQAAFGPLPDFSDAERFPPTGGPQANDGTRQARWWSMAAQDRDAVTRVFVNAGKAIAAWEATIRSGPTAFDRFVADLRAGKLDSQAMSLSAQRGLKIFVGKGDCVLCHSGPYFTNLEFHDVRVPPLATGAVRDPGRALGVQRLSEDEFIAAGPHSDDAEGPRAQQLFYLNPEGGLRGHFKTPSLRNVATTAPYMHQGQFKTLHEVVRYYSTLEGAVEPGDPAHVEKLIRPLQLNDSEIDDVVAFLESLTSAPWR
jgi:cytochrome c peroxidase